MSRILNPTTSSSSAVPAAPSPDLLYPVVQDLTDAEYGTGICCGGMMGAFSLEDLALPNINARPLPTEPACPSNPGRRKKGHFRGHSLFLFTPSMVRNAAVNHKRSSSAPDKVESCSTMKSTTPTASSAENTEDDGDRKDAIAFDDIFVLTRQVYRCNISTVWECVHREQGTRHCVKMIDKRRLTCKADTESVLREIGILTSLQTYQSSRLPRLVQISEDEHQYYLVMDFVEGGNLAAFRQSKHHLPEDHIQAIAHSLLLGLAELHRLSVAHLNLAPDNILLEPNLSDVVLCDFGCAWDLRHTNFTAIANSLGNVGKATTIHDNDVSSVGSGGTSSSCPRYGSLQYAAPELIGPNQEFGLAADMWSVGVILYQLFCGHLPFEDVSRRALKEKIASGKYKFEGEEWHEVSRGAKQFISTLLHPDPQVRMTVREALTHPWLTQPLGGRFAADDAPREGSPYKTSPKSTRRRISLVQRLWERIRSNSASDADSEPTSTPMALKSTEESLLFDLKSAGSSLTVATSSSSYLAPEHNWEATTLPRPLDHYRRPSLVGL